MQVSFRSKSAAKAISIARLMLLLLQFTVFFEVKIPLTAHVSKQLALHMQIVTLLPATTQHKKRYKPNTRQKLRGKYAATQDDLVGVTKNPYAFYYIQA